ncbi:bifunctional riboflavin kinase/FAD synthetase [Niallia taxi]|uniref:bifunctional riboflavin kinase/FAD synthetase n=1 Tax=Niallia taxi TaxID=2499688 RepID=UPI0035CD0FD0
MKVARIDNIENMHSMDFPPLVMALGYFDGVHLGHQKVIGEAKKVADELGIKTGVMTFDPHPSLVLSKEKKQIGLITSLDTKIAEMEKLGVDYLFIIHFTKEFAALEPQQFVDQYLVGLHAKHVVAGFDYTYGMKAAGTSETLEEHSRGQFGITIINKETFEGEKVSSTLIRSHINTGAMDKVPMLLGRYYSIHGRVIHGDKRGRTIGFPTANVEAAGEEIIPPQGVYAVKVLVDGKWYEGVCNVGTKPTFHPEKTVQSIEAHIFDFNQEIYDKTITIEWHIRIRSEKKFNGIQELVEQIAKDKQTAVEYFATLNV